MRGIMLWAWAYCIGSVVSALFLVRRYFDAHSET